MGWGKNSFNRSPKGTGKQGVGKLSASQDTLGSSVIPNFPTAFQDATGWIRQFPMAEAMGWIPSSFQEDKGI